MPATKLTTEEIHEKLEPLSGWKLVNQGIQKDFEFADFSEAFGFLTRIALLSEKLNHHADWSGVYNRVHIRLSTHDAGGVTAKDLQMARAIEGFMG
jgi:4a-hydroxytetrahydrobiopterin dehydratase